MKNVRRLLVAAFALVSVSSVAGLVQPVRPASEDAPVRFNGGLLGGASGTKDGFGVRNAGIGLGFNHNVGYDFEYGMSLAGNWVSHSSKIFTDAAKGTEGPGMDVELMTRYMPEIAERLHAGLTISLGWTHQFGANAKPINDQVSFGTLNVKVGPALSVGFGDVVSAYVSTQFSLHNIRFGAKEGSDAAKTNNQMGLDIPLGFWFAIADNAGVFIEGNSRFTNFKEFTKSFKEEVTLGMGFAI